MLEQYLATIPAKMSDLDQFIELIQDADIQNTFHNLRGMDKLRAATFLQAQIIAMAERKPNFFKLIKILYSPDLDLANEQNSVVIGFINLHDSGDMDRLLTGGFNHQLSFALASKYRKKGLMTIALNMTIETMIHDGFNVVPSLAKNAGSERVLLRCGFKIVNSTPLGTFLVRRLNMDERKFANDFFNHPD